jgi:hypothetical protein
LGQINAQTPTQRKILVGLYTLGNRANIQPSDKNNSGFDNGTGSGFIGSPDNKGLINF